jgi:hypothetical protein
MGRLKRFKIISDQYRNRPKHFGLRFNLIASIYNFESVSWGFERTLFSRLRAAIESCVMRGQDWTSSLQCLVKILRTNWFLALVHGSKVSNIKSYVAEFDYDRFQPDVNLTRSSVRTIYGVFFQSSSFWSGKTTHMTITLITVKYLEYGALIVPDFGCRIRNRSRRMGLKLTDH